MRRVAEEGAALYVPDGARFVPTVYAQGPWDANAQFGGAPNALVATLVERTPALAPMQLARLTTDLMRPVPLQPITAEVRVVREGKKIQVVAVSLLADGIEVVRSTALRLRRADLGLEGLPDGREPVALPGPRPVDADPFPPEPHGGRLATEYLHEATGGHYFDPTWVRLRVDVIAGERPLPVARVAHAADLASGGPHRFTVPVTWINADLTVNMVREPAGDWLQIDGGGWVGGHGLGQAQAVMSDTGGVVASVTAVRLVDRPGADGHTLPPALVQPERHRLAGHPDPSRTG
ncbi:MAG TPA: thioesterase family protein [Acidimicrobiales bacterium]|nr:thioesterase family protein [Acidimicrobiales bacterium]